jgi:hypothetical protein
LTESDRRTLRRIVLKNHRQVTAELNIDLEDPVSTNNVVREFHKSNIDGGTAVGKPLITEMNAQIRKRWCHDHKTWQSDNQTTGNARVI